MTTTADAIDAARTCPKARCSLIRCSMGLVYRVVQRWTRREAHDWDDLVQAGMLGMNCAIDNYDASRGSAWSTHATIWILQKVSREALKCRHTIRVPVHAHDASKRVLRGKGSQGDQKYAGMHKTCVSSLDSPVSAHNASTLHDLLPGQDTPADIALDAKRRIADALSRAGNGANATMWALRATGYSLSEAAAYAGRNVSRERARQICVQVQHRVDRVSSPHQLIPAHLPEDKKDTPVSVRTTKVDLIADEAKRARKEALVLRNDTIEALLRQGAHANYIAAAIGLSPHTIRPILAKFRAQLDIHTERTRRLQRKAKVAELLMNGASVRDVSTAIGVSYEVARRACAIYRHARAAPSARADASDV
jgi:RNA polymerase sigma factor (sigma-70 family)